MMSLVEIIADCFMLASYVALPVYVLYLAFRLWKHRSLRRCDILIGIIVTACTIFVRYEMEEPIKPLPNSIPVEQVASLSEKEIVRVILTQELEYYKSKRLLTSKKIFDYRIHDINYPFGKAELAKEYPGRYDVSLSVKTFEFGWIPGSGTRDGLWIRKGISYGLKKSGDRYLLEQVGSP